MQGKAKLGLGLLVVFGTAAFAHEGVKNPAVMARMHNMKDIAGYTKVLGDMAKGATAFDLATAQAAAADLAKASSKVVPLFNAVEHDPKSEALMTIWVSFPEFAMRATRLTDVANAAKTSITDQASLAEAVKEIGATCSSCHGSFRKD